MSGRSDAVWKILTVVCGRGKAIASGAGQIERSGQAVAAGKWRGAKDRAKPTKPRWG
jgi:hypothetical protein